MIHFLSHFSAGMVAVIVIGLSMLLSVACLWLVQRYFKFLHFMEATDHGVNFLQSIGVIIALIFAFVTVAVWGNFSGVDKSISREANVLHNIYRNVESYPPEISSQVKPLMRDYVNQVVKVEWHTLREGKEDEESHRLISRISQIMVAYRPANISELPLHSETLRLISENRGLRHDRIKGSEPNLGPPMWIALFCAALFFILYSSMFIISRFSTHVLMIAALGASLGLMFYLLVIYNYPFLEPAELSNEPFRRLLEFYWK